MSTFEKSMLKMSVEQIDTYLGKYFASYSCPPPPVCTAYWDGKSWARWIVSAGSYVLKEGVTLPDFFSE